MGVYGYSAAAHAKPQKYLNVKKETGETRVSMTRSCTRHPVVATTRPRNDGVGIPDPHQSFVWGAQAEDPRLDEHLINPLDYGTVLNLSLCSRLFADGPWHGRTELDFHHCIENTPEAGNRVRVFKQMPKATFETWQN